MNKQSPAPQSGDGGPAAISAQLVDMRNVGTHKSLKLTLHVPEEQALAAIEAFGWPTGTHPVPVALARLKSESEVMPNSRDRNLPEHKTPPAAAPEQPARAKSWHDMSPAQQAGILCADKSFQKFCGAKNEETAAEWVRQTCGVESRSQIHEGDKSNDHWLTIVSRYRTWMHDPEYV